MSCDSQTHPAVHKLRYVTYKLEIIKISAFDNARGKTQPLVEECLQDAYKHLYGINTKCRLPSLSTHPPRDYLDPESMNPQALFHTHTHSTMPLDL
jgi:hypothetical protein